MNIKRGFTLIELLIVIAIIATLSVVVVITLNPAELLRQARDSTRISDLDNLNKAISLYNADQKNSYFGENQIIYISIPDPQATTTQGTNCTSLNLPSLPVGWEYHCAASSSYRKTDGSGWVPINFTQISFQSPFGTLPIDPLNQAATGHYYTYQKGSWELSAVMESNKFGPNTPNSPSIIDQGNYPQIYEIGLAVNLLPINRATAAVSTSTPQVNIINPTNNSTVSGTITLLASASDTLGIQGVQFFSDGIAIGGQINTPPYQTNWNTSSTINGSHSLLAVATNNAGVSSTSPLINTIVNNSSSSFPSLVQFTVTSNAPANTCSAQLNASSTAGNLLVFSVDTNSSTAILSVSDNRGNTWQNANTRTNGNGSQSIYYAINGSTGVTNVTVTITNWAGAFRSCELAEYSGANIFDDQASASGSGTQGNSGDVTTTYANSLIIGAGSTPQSSSTFTPDQGFIIVSASAKSFQAYKVVGATGTYSAGTSISTSTSWLMNAAVFH